MPRPIFILSVKLITNLNPWLRSAPLANFDLSKVQKNISNFKPNDIGPYLAGLFEGDGHVSLSKIINSKGKISYPYLAITFVNKDLPLINKLLELCGGRLRHKTKENAIVWIVNTHKELISLINLMNGYLRTPKINKFNELIVWLNERYHYNIPIHYVDSSSLNSNGWLSCFIEADGAFKVRCLQLKNGKMKKLIKY